MLGQSGNQEPGNRFPPQVSRLVAVFVVLGALFVGARTVLRPATFGDLGNYRAVAISAVTSREPRYAGHEACEPCHEPVVTKKAGSYHRGLACEVCHGAQAAHVVSPIENTPPAPRDRAFCPLCHAYNPSRPTGFPQIDASTHNPGRACITCHDPHDPTPPHPPESCSACHGEIWRTKAVSYHAQLPCTQCHEVDSRHVTSPRQFLPTRPQTREFCGQCHSQTATSPREIPRIDLATHNPRYMCWQCHYPHHPEANR